MVLLYRSPSGAKRGVLLGSKDFYLPLLLGGGRGQHPVGKLNRGYRTEAEEDRS